MGALSSANGHDPLVSVIMNCFNGEKYLCEAVDSVLAQSYRNWEIVFWDNQSTDASAEIFQGYNDPRFRYMRASRHTLLGEARNLAVAEACGSWIAFLDADDKWLSSRLREHMDVAQSEVGDLGLIYGRAELLLDSDMPRRSWFRRPVRSGAFIPDPRKYHRLPEGWILEHLARDNFIPLVAATVKRELFLSAGGFSGRFNQAEDYEMFFRVARIARVRAVEGVTAIYRMHASNLSHQQKDLAISEAIALLKELPPSAARTEGLRINYTDRAVQLIQNGRWLSGFAVLFSEGSLANLLGRVVHRLGR